MSWSRRHPGKLMCIETKCALKTQVRFLVPPTPGGPGLRPALCGLSRDATRLPIPRRRGPHRPRTRVAALETMRGAGPACLVWGQCPANRVQDGGVRAGDTEFTAQGAPGLSGMVQTRGRGWGARLAPHATQIPGRAEARRFRRAPCCPVAPAGSPAPSGFARRRRSQPARCAQDHSAPFDLRRAGTAGLGCSPYRANSPGARVRLIPPPSAGRLRGAQESVVRAQQEKSVQRRQTAGRRGEPPCAVWC